MGMTATSALWFLPVMTPIAIYIAYNDMRTMKITNATVVALVIAYAIVGPFAFGWETYFWQWLHLPIMLVVCIALWMLRAMGGGDAKIIAAMSPIFMVGDTLLILMIYTAALIAGLATHTLFRLTPLKRLAPHWKSAESGYWVPKGLSLGMTLVFYLAVIAIYR